MKEKIIRLIIYYVISVYEDEKKTKETCNEIANLLLLMIKNEETKADRLIKIFPDKHPVKMVYNEIKETNKEELTKTLEEAIKSLNKFSFEKECLVNLADDSEVENLSKEISEI